MTLTVIKANPTISFGDITKTFGDPDFTLSATSSSTGVFTYSIADGSVASVSGNTVTIQGAGSTIVTVNQISNSNYESATATMTLTVEKANQYITVDEIPIVQPLKDFVTLPISATSSSGAPVIISLAGGSAAVLSGSVSNYELTSINQTGLVTITFDTDPAFHPNYDSATLTIVIDVVKSNQNIIFNPNPPTVLYYTENLAYTINASSDSFLEVGYEMIFPTSSSVDISLSNNKLEINDVGFIRVRHTQPGNNVYNMAAPRIVEINVLKGQTTLSDFAIPTKLITDDDFEIIPPTSNRAGAFIYTSSNTEIANVTGDQIIITGIGSCTITATQPESDKYNSASISAVFIVNDIDTDGDGIPNNIDLDDDGDGYLDQDEILCSSDPLDNSSTPTDTDGDFIANCIDTDDDNDGTLDQNDAFPLDPLEDNDNDGDGIGDNADTDDDNDGYSDQDEVLCSSDPLDNSSIPLDNDGDFLADCVDSDDDNDGIPDNNDAFPFDGTEDSDNDGDGIGDNEDPDDDNDTILDVDEEVDDTDGDGILNYLDEDDDNDGILTIDEDTNGNNDPTDDDQDSDGIYDALESNIEDTDKDGVSDQQDTENNNPYNDQDGDGYSNIDEIAGGTDPLDSNSKPEDFKSNNFDINITAFFSPNGDGIGDTWKIQEVERYSNSKVWIFSRTGKQVYRASPYRNNWNGEFNGKPLPSGSYFYRLDLDGNGNVDFEGWIYLNR